MDHKSRTKMLDCRNSDYRVSINSGVMFTTRWRTATASNSVSLEGEFMLRVKEQNAEKQNLLEAIRTAENQKAADLLFPQMSTPFLDRLRL